MQLGARGESVTLDPPDREVDSGAAEFCGEIELNVHDLSASFDKAHDRAAEFETALGSKPDAAPNLP